MLSRKVGITARLSLRFNSTVAQNAVKRVQKDVVIVGGGPAGLSLATALKSSPIASGLDVTLIEGQSMDRLKGWKDRVTSDKYENRVSSLTPRSVRFLQRIGAWDHVAQDRVMPYDEMKVWDGVSGSRIEFDPFYDGETTEIAYMIENSNIQQGLLERLGSHGFNDIHDSAKVTEIRQGNWPTVVLDNGLEIEARLLVGCDGQQSPVRKFSGIESRGWDYGRFGVVASLDLEYDNSRAVAYQRFLPSGPIAMLPMPEGHATLVWSTLPERAKWLQQLEPKAFCAMVNAGFRLEPVDLDYLHKMDPADTAAILDEIDWRLDNTPIEDEVNNLPVYVENLQENTRAGFPMRMRHADTYVEERIALVGDAAHATHPLAGQGLNMGQRDVEFLLEALETAIGRGLDIGSLMALEPYWKSAYLPNHLKLGVVDKLHALYSTDFWPVVQLRSVGLSMVNSSDFLKSLLIRQASN